MVSAAALVLPPAGVVSCFSKITVDSCVLGTGNPAREREAAKDVDDKAGSARWHMERWHSHACQRMHCSFTYEADKSRRLACISSWEVNEKRLLRLVDRYEFSASVNVKAEEVGVWAELCKSRRCG